MVKPIINREDRSLLSRWWRTVDPYLLAAFAILILIGGLMVITASPAVAHRVGYDPVHFIFRQFIFLATGIGMIFIISLLDPRDIRRICTVGLGFGLLAMIIVLFIGDETKGSTRWLNIGSLSLQPSEFLKPCFYVFTAWMFSEKLKNKEFPGFSVAISAYLLVVLLLVLQPDIGTTITFTLVWGAMFFMAGLPVIFIAIFGMIAIAAAVGAYLIFPHVAARVDKFLSADNEQNYQVSKSLEAFAKGGIFGRGPGEGVVKEHIPDSHTDFIFAVLGEEMGLIAVLLVIGLFAFITLRVFTRLYKQKDIFVTFACAGIIMNFALQAIINMGVTVKLMPTKGMTLPFISYGGSSILATSISVGILLGLTRKRYDKRL